MKIFTIGGAGLVGSRISELLSDTHSFTDLSPSTGVDITDPSTLELINNDLEHKIVILLAAKTDVDGCEQDKTLGEAGDAWKVNVGGVQNVVNACLENNKKLIYISTDFVFDGSTPGVGGYTEDDSPNPINWYGKTKFEGEEVVRNSGLPFIIARIAYPYRKIFEPKLDFVRAIINRLKNGQSVSAITDHIFTPTFIDDIAFGIDRLVANESIGIFHVTGSQSLSPYDASVLIAEKFGLDKSLIQKSTRAEYFKDKALRPFNVAMNNAKIKKLGIKMKTLTEGFDSLL